MYFFSREFQLLNKGFKLIDALDGSQGMLDLAKPKGFYQNYFCSFMEETQGLIEDGTSKCKLMAVVRQRFYHISVPGWSFLSKTLRVRSRFDC